MIFAEVTPKTIAALYPEKIAYPSSLILILLLKILYPCGVGGQCRFECLGSSLGFNSESDDSHQQLSAEELRTVVYESGERLPRRRQGMLLNILDLEHVTVNDILVPRNEILGIDIEDDIDEILSLIGSSQHTRMPVYKKEIDNLIGILHLRSVGKLIRLETVNKAANPARDNRALLHSGKHAAAHTAIKISEKEITHGGRSR